MEISENYRIYKVAEMVAEHIGLTMGSSKIEWGDANSVPLENFTMFPYDSDRHLSFTLHSGILKPMSQNEPNTFLRSAEEGNNFVHYEGAKSEGNILELLYATNGSKLLVTTFGWPEDIGVVELTDVKGSIALQELSSVTTGMDGRGSIIYNYGAPKPQPCKGIAQFRGEGFDQFYKTIETLLEDF
jgi:hypothetical protein